MLSFLENDFLQMSQENGFWPVCIRTCLFKSLRRKKLRPQNEHTCSLGISSGWPRICERRYWYCLPWSWWPTTVNEFDLTFGASDTTKSSAFASAVFSLPFSVERCGSVLGYSLRSSLIRLRIVCRYNANSVSRYMRQTYGQRSFPDVFCLTLCG